MRIHLLSEVMGVSRGAFCLAGGPASAWKTPVERRSTCGQLWVSSPIQLSVGVVARFKMAAKMATCDSHILHRFSKTLKQTGGKADPKLANQILIQKLNG